MIVPKNTFITICILQVIYSFQKIKKKKKVKV